jgi:RimJ/RimL family protein N-acetyltransferase
MEVHWCSVRNNPVEHQQLCKWASFRIWDDGAFLNRCDTSMAVIDDEKLIAVIVYHNYDPKARIIEYSGAADSSKWLTPEVLFEMFEYPFEQLNCQLVVTRNSEHQTQLHRQLKSTGHIPHRIERLRGPEEADIVWTLTRETWLSNKFTKRTRKQRNGFQQQISTSANAT